MLSVAMSTYNGEKYIEDQLMSILQQTLPADEVVICDDGSTDHTIDIIECFIESKCLGDKWKLYRNKENLGYINNFLHAIELTHGDYIFLSDQDDIFEVNKFQTILNYFLQNEEVLLINSNYTYVDEFGKKLSGVAYKSPKRIRGIHSLNFRKMLYNSNYPGFAMAFRRNLLYNIDSLNITQCYGHDILLNLLAISKKGCYEISDNLNFYRMHKNNTSRQWGGNECCLYDRRIAQKENELSEFEKLKNICAVNNLNNVDFLFIDYRKRVLEKRILALKNKKIAPLLSIFFKEKAYPKRTILGDMLFVLQKRIGYLK